MDTKRNNFLVYIGSIMSYNNRINWKGKGPTNYYKESSV